jgi:hypothetical protein
VGGHRWRIRYYPNGNKPETKDYISLYLLLDDSVAKAVKAQFKFRFVGDVAEQLLILGGLDNFESHTSWGYPKFIKKEDLEASKHLRDDSFAIRCDVVVTNELRVEEVPEATAPADSISVPPSDLHQHLGSLLLSEKGADVVFDVRCTPVRTRSPFACLQCRALWRDERERHRRCGAHRGHGTSSVQGFALLRLHRLIIPKDKDNDDETS